MKNHKSNSEECPNLINLKCKTTVLFLRLFLWFAHEGGSGKVCLCRRHQHSPSWTLKRTQVCGKDGGKCLLGCPQRHRVATLLATHGPSLPGFGGKPNPRNMKWLIQVMAEAVLEVGVSLCVPKGVPHPHHCLLNLLLAPLSP